jgi:hypothetical protein
MPLMYGDFRTLYVDDAVWVFLRHYMGEWTMVALNIRYDAANVTVALPEFAKCGELKVAVATDGGQAKCLGEGRIELTIPARGYVVVNK